MKKNRKSYPLNQSPLFKLRTIDSLSNVLNCKPSTLKRIERRGSLNYYFTHLDDSKKRELQIPKVQLKRVHIRINNLLSRIKPPVYLQSGVKGRSNIGNAKYHISGALAKLDIKNFYTSTTQSLVERTFRKIFSCTREVSVFLSSLCCVKGHLPTGSPISQSLAFYSNLGAFNHIYQYASSRGIKFSVYVDDLTFSGKMIPRNFLHYVSCYLNKSRGYKCHKFRTYNATTPKVVTGAVIDNGVLKVRNAHRLKLSDLLGKYDHVVESHEPDSEEIVIYFQKLIGHLFSAGQINGRYYQKGRIIVEQRAGLGIKSLNQNSSSKSNI
ncbi:MAG: reverse transcriptase family protein [Oceanobacter sp.]